MEKIKTETKIPQQKYKQDKIMVKQKDIQTDKNIRKKPSLETKEQGSVKAGLKKRNEQKTVTKKTTDTKPNNQVSPTRGLQMQMQKIGLKDQKCETLSEENVKNIQHITKSQYDNVCIPNIKEKSSDVSPSNQIRIKIQPNNDTERIYNNHIKIDPTEEIAEIKNETKNIKINLN